jgi:tetratricopeptide (TPR) repeat protein
MITRWAGLATLGLLLVLHLLFYQQTFAMKSALDAKVQVNYVLPAEFSQIVALDWQGLAADFQLLQAIFFIGEKIERQDPIEDAEWDHFVRIIKTVIQLDPYFYDTYHLASGMLTWGVGRFEDAIEILEVAREYNPDDYRFPYQIGFIYFYFLEDAEKGAYYLEIASRLPEAPPLMASLASRLSYYTGNYEFSINLLERMLIAERNPAIRGYYQKRLDALGRALALEKAVFRFKQEQGSLPVDLLKLVSEGYLESIPEDPYGGEWIMVKNGRIYTTSNFSEAKQ